MRPRISTPTLGSVHGLSVRTRHWAARSRRMSWRRSRARISSRVFSPNPNPVPMPGLESEIRGVDRRVWRIATDTPDYVADDLAGTGARLTDGRWNRPGLSVLYCACSPSLACIETLVHPGTGSLPMNRYLVAIDIRNAVWDSKMTETASSLPVGWDATPAGKVSLDFGDAWLSAGTSAVLTVPSVIVPEDAIILINPQHPDSTRLTATKLRRWL